MHLSVPWKSLVGKVGQWNTTSSKGPERDPNSYVNVKELDYKFWGSLDQGWSESECRGW